MGERSGRRARFGRRAHEIMPAAPLPDGWETKISGKKDTGRTYYYHRATKTKQWEWPISAPVKESQLRRFNNEKRSSSRSSATGTLDASKSECDPPVRRSRSRSGSRSRRKIVNSGNASESEVRSSNSKSAGRLSRESRRAAKVPAAAPSRSKSECAPRRGTGISVIHCKDKFVWADNMHSTFRKNDGEMFNYKVPFKGSLLQDLHLENYGITHA